MLSQLMTVLQHSYVSTFRTCSRYFYFEGKKLLFMWMWLSSWIIQFKWFFYFFSTISRKNNFFSRDDKTWNWFQLVFFLIHRPVPSHTQPYMCTHTYAHKYLHTRTLIYAHTNTNTRTYIHAHFHIHTCSHIHTLIYSDTSTHTYTHSYAFTYTQTNAHT